MPSPFCRWIESEESWTCSSCGTVVPKSACPDVPFAACRAGTQALGLETDRTVTNVVQVRVLPYAQGPGTELKKLLKSFGIVPKAGCSCNEKALLMNQWGVEGCEQRTDEIVGWLREEAADRGLPFVETLARTMVRHAISKARKRENENAARSQQ